jgi:hypothetical protein
MKQYTTPEQTAKLIELWFEKPKSMNGVYNGCQFAPTPAYSIGELIEILPKIIETEIWWGDEKGKIGVWGLRIDTEGVEYMWTITYERDHSANLGVVGAGEELIDALYDMVIKLKEEGVI